MSTKILDEQWTAVPAHPGRIAVGDAIDVQVRVAIWRVPGGDAEAMRLVKETGALCLAAPAMAKALLLALATADFPGHAEATIRKALIAAMVEIPDPD